MPAKTQKIGICKDWYVMLTYWDSGYSHGILYHSNPRDREDYIASDSEDPETLICNCRECIYEDLPETLMGKWLMLAKSIQDE